ncbi:MAG: TylF/MycF family methyltransferase [Bacteroidales bacterium]|nr:TylF/MycF family methyltransferase [Bacteroidales bacterium]
MNFFQVISSFLVLVVLILLVRYAWGIFFDKNYQPVEWLHFLKEGRINKELVRLERSYPDKVRFFNWWFQVERLKRAGVPGDFAELGVYKGESAKILHLMDPSRTFHLYDTFEGFREEDLKHETGEAASYSTRNFADTSLEAVKRYLGEEGKFVYHAGNFDFTAPTPSLPQLGEGEREGALALVNLDADLYQPTRAGLAYFYPLLSPGGVIIVHDYNYKWPGIKMAVDEFAATIPESVVMVPDMDGSVMIIKSLR